MFAYSVYVHRSNLTAPPIVPGWRELISCSVAVSLDGTRELRLSEDHRAMLQDKSLSKDERPDKDIGADGTWSFDDRSKKYSVSNGNTTVAYTLVSPEQTGTCILIRGTLDSANLLESWFSAPTDDDPGDYYDREREVHD